MANQVRIRASVDDQASRKLSGIRGQIEQISAGAKEGILAGVGLGAGISAFNLASSAVGGVVSALGDASAEATGLAEAQSKVNVVFGEGSTDLEAWAAGAAKIGLSRRAALEAVGTYGNLFQAFGVGRAEAQKMSVSLVELAADLASFNNTSIDDALIALRSGLSGETEPLKRYGIAISDARMRTALMAQGVTNLGSTLTPLQKSQAAYTLILKDSTLAQGDFIRTSDGLANSQRQVQAEIDNAMAAIGQEVASIQLGAIKVARALADDPFEGFAMNFGEQADRIDEIAARTGMTLDDLRAKIEARMDETGESFADAATGIENDWTDTASALNHETERAMYAMQRSVAAGGQEVAREFERIAADGVSTMSKAARGFRDAAYQSQVEYAKGLLDAQNEPQVALDALIQLQEETLSNQAQVNRLLGQLNSEELAAGMADSRPAVRAQALATRQAILNQLSNLGVSAEQWGYNTGTSYADGLNAAYGYVRDAAGNLARATRSQIGINSEPEGADSPLRGITNWGGNVASTIAEGMLSKVGTVRSAASRLAGAMAPSFGDPAYAGVGGSAGGSTGGPVVIQLQLDGRTVAEVVDQSLYYTRPRGGLLPR